MLLLVFACFRMFTMVPQSVSSLVPNLVPEVPKDQAVFQKAKGCQEGSLGSLGILNDAAMAGKRVLAVRLDQCIKSDQVLVSITCCCQWFQIIHFCSW